MISSANVHWPLAAMSAVASAALAAGCGGGHAARTSSSAAFSHSPSTAGPSQPQSQSSAALDPPPPGGVRIAASGFPAMITADSGSIWVFAHRSVYAYRIDPSTNRIVAKVNIHDTPCTLASAGDGLVWNSNCGPGENSVGISFAINPRTDRLVSRRIRGNNPTFGAGSLWVLNDSGSAVRRVDPQSGVVLASIPTGIDELPGGGSLGIGGVGHGSVWLVSDSAKSVTRISTATDKVTDVITLTGAKTGDEAFPYAAEQNIGYINGASVAFTPGKAWYANPAGLFEIDAHTNRARRISLGMRPFTNWGDDTVVSGAGSVWLRTTNTTIDRIDPASGKVQAVYPAGREGGGGDIAVAFGSLWVDNAGSDSVWREPIRTG